MINLTTKDTYINELLDFPYQIWPDQCDECDWIVDSDPDPDYLDQDNEMFENYLAQVYEEKMQKALISQKLQ